MRLKLSSLLTLLSMLIQPNLANAMDDQHKYCGLAGFFVTVQDRFAADLVFEKLKSLKLNINDETACSAVYRDGTATGKYYAESGKLRNLDDIELMHMAIEFKEKINLFILNGAGL
jgi:hypothetical protein